MRTLLDIQEERAAVRVRLAELEDEYRAFVERRNAGIVADFDAGMSRAELVAKWQTSYSQIGSALNSRGRSNKKRATRPFVDFRDQLPLAQRAHFDRLLRGKVPFAAARQIAQTVSTPTAARIAAVVPAAAGIPTPAAAAPSTRTHYATPPHGDEIRAHDLRG